MLIDIVEQEIVNMDEKTFNILLFDRTTKKNIVWASDNYEKYGAGYKAEDEIKAGFVTGINTKVIKPRISRTKREQEKRTKEAAEVFTPSWVCNIQNNLIDEEWFGRKNVFNTPDNESWITTCEKIEFPENKSWKDYVDTKRLEITCGEAPYLVSRYDTVTGDAIPIRNRIGLLDRKFRVLNENVNDIEEWLIWATRAVQSVYGYEYQGDSLLIARENIYSTFLENMEEKFSCRPLNKTLRNIAKIISWNLWQMDGFTNTPPFSEVVKNYPNTQLFYDPDVEEKKEVKISNYCKIFDWRSNESVEFRTLIRG